MHSHGLVRVRPLGRLIVAVTALTAGGLLTTSHAEPSPQENTVLRDPFQSAPVTPATFDGDVRDLPTAASWKPGDPIRENPRRFYPRSTGTSERSPGPDPLLPTTPAPPATEYATTAGGNLGNPILNFPGIGFTGSCPPDTVGDVGPNHYIQMVNGGAVGSQFTIFDKQGNTLAGPTPLQSLWTAGGPCAVGAGDPIVLYDRLADRWLMSEFADPNQGMGNSLCVYISQTNDPVTGGWFLYCFDTAEFPDYPKYAVWPDAYYVSSNESSPAVYAMDRTNMLTGNAATFQRFTAPNLAGFGFQAMTPGDLDGATAPPAGSPGYFMRHRDDEAHNPGANDPANDFLEIWQFQVDFATPGNSTFTGPTNIPITEFDSNLCDLDTMACFPQPGTGQLLDPVHQVVMWRLQYRNFGTHETLVGNMVTDVDGNDRGGIRWFELRRTGGGAWSLVQEGTQTPDQDNRWMGSAAMDSAGNLAVGYSVSSANTFPAIRYAGRLANDPQGTLPQGENTIINGGTSQTDCNRWGDYASLNIDPTDDLTFWFTTEYVTANGDWQTQIATFRFGDMPPGGDDPRAVKQQAITALMATAAAINAGAAGVDDPEEAVDEIEDAIDDIQDSLDTDLWAMTAQGGIDPLRLVCDDGEEVFEEEEDAVDAIFDAIEDGEIENMALLNDLVNIANTLVMADRRLAEVAIMDAQADPNADEDDLEDAMEELEDGDEEVQDAAGEDDLDDKDDDLEDAIDDYADAWEEAMDAVDCDDGFAPDAFPQVPTRYDVRFAPAVRAIDVLAGVARAIDDGAPDVKEPQDATARIGNAVGDLEDSLDGELWAAAATVEVDRRRLDREKGDEVFEQTAHALQSILEAIDDGGIDNAALASKLLAVVDEMVQANRELARMAIVDRWSIRERAQDDIVDALQAMQKLQVGDRHADRIADETDLAVLDVLVEEALDAYAEAWEQAIEATSRRD